MIEKLNYNKQYVKGKLFKKNNASIYYGLKYIFFKYIEDKNISISALTLKTSKN